MEQYLTTNEAAAYLKISRQTLQKWKKKRVVKFLKVGGVIRYKQSDLDNLLTQKQSAK